MSYLKHKVSLPQNLEDLEDGDGASAIYVGDTKIVPANIGGIGQRVRKPGIPYWLDHAVSEWLRVWSNTHDFNDYLTINADIPTNWTNYQALVRGTPGDPSSAQYSSNIGEIFNATGMTPWGMGTLNDGWGYVSDPDNRFDITKDPNGDIWTELTTTTFNRVQCRASIARGSTETGDSWWDTGSTTTIRQKYARRVLYRLAAFEAGLFMDHPQSLWTTVLTDSQIRLLASSIHSLISVTGLPNFHWLVDDASLGTVKLGHNPGQAGQADILELVTDATLQPLGEPRTVWDYHYSASGTEVFQIRKEFEQKSLDDGDSLELSNALNTTHQVIWLTPEIAFSPTGTIKMHFHDSGTLTGTGYVEAKWMLDSLMFTGGWGSIADNLNAGMNSVTSDGPSLKWEDTFLITVTHSMGHPVPWDRFIVGYRSANLGEVKQVTGDAEYLRKGGDESKINRAISIGVIVPNTYSETIYGSLEVTRDGIGDISEFWSRGDNINGVW